MMVSQDQVEKKLMQHREEVTGRLSSQKRIDRNMNTWYCLKIEHDENTQEIYWISDSFCKTKSVLGIRQWLNYLQQENKIFTLEAHWVKITESSYDFVSR